MTYSKFTSNGREIRITPQQIKKHHSTFTQAESSILSSVVESLKTRYLHITKHAREHVYDLSYTDVITVLNDCTIIEFNCTGDDCRLLLRCNHATHVYVDNGSEIDYTLCLVISIHTGNVIAGFCNRTDDAHDSLIETRYDPSINIVEIALGLN